MKYKLLIKEPEYSSCKVTCACGKCVPAIYISEDMKEEFKKMMQWNEDEFIRRTIMCEEDAEPQSSE